MEDYEASENAQSIDSLIREIEARDQEIEEALESIIQEDERPTHERRQTETLNASSARG